MKSAFLLLVVSLFSAVAVWSQSTTKIEEGEAAYIRTTNSRAQKIVTALAIKDSSKFYRVQDAIAKQYQNLSKLHAGRDEAVKKIKAGTNDDATKQRLIKEIQDGTDIKIKELHTFFLNQLSKELTEPQLVQVKDGMTYNVVNITYAGYLDMLQNLTAEQKAQIKTWLVEAREYAMDAETSDKKHWWFGKYKGRINNYLSAAGYDMKKEGEAWQQRIKERDAAKTN